MTEQIIIKCIINDISDILIEVLRKKPWRKGEKYRNLGKTILVRGNIKK
jgi:hypothetical protein